MRSLSFPWQRRLLSATFRAAAVRSFRGGNTPTAAVWAKETGPQRRFSFGKLSRPMASSAMSVVEDPGEVLSSNTDSQYSDYEKWVRRLYMTNLFHPVKMGLQNVQELHELVGNPMDDVCFHFL
jgi:hypothetical protein